MSIILDALRKAEASRGEHGRHSLTVHPPVRTEARSRLPSGPRALAAVAGAALLGVAAVAYLLFSEQASEDAVPASPSALSAPTSGPVPATPAVTTAPAPVTAAPEAPVPPSPAATTPSSGDVRMLALEARLATPPTTSPTSGGSVEVRDFMGEANAARPNAAPPIQPGRVEVRDLLAEEGLAPPVAPEPSAPATTSESAEREALANKERGLLAAAPPRAAPATPTLNELVANGQLNPPEISLDMHAYADDPAARFVYINMRRYRIGETTREGATVEEITPSGVVLLLQGRRFLIDSR